MLPVAFLPQLSRGCDSLEARHDWKRPNQKGKPRMSEAIALLSRIEEVTPEWVTQVLEAGGLTGIQIQGFEAQSIGTGQVGENVRLTLQYGTGSVTQYGANGLLCNFHCYIPIWMGLYSNCTSCCYTRSLPMSKRKNGTNCNPVFNDSYFNNYSKK